MSYGNLLNNEVDIKAPSYADDEQGGQTTAWTTIYRNVSCRFNALSRREEMIAFAKGQTFANFTVYLEYLSNIHEGDRLCLGTRTFEVKLIQNWDEQNDQMALAVVELGRNE